MDFEEWKKENLSKGESKTWVEWCELAYEAGQQSKQAQINKALELLRQPMQGTVADLLSDLEGILDDT